MLTSALLFNASQLITACTQNLLVVTTDINVTFLSHTPHSPPLQMIYNCQIPTVLLSLFRCGGSIHLQCKQQQLGSFYKILLVFTLLGFYTTDAQAFITIKVEQLFLFVWLKNSFIIIIILTHEVQLPLQKQTNLFIQKTLLFPVTSVKYLYLYSSEEWLTLATYACRCAAFINIQPIGQKPFQGSVCIPNPLFQKVSQRIAWQPFWAFPHPALFYRPEVPAQNASRGLTMGRKRKFHVGISCTGHDLLPETRSTPFCNHTLHFGGLTMKNTQKNKKNRKGWGKRCWGREKGMQLATIGALGKQDRHGLHD